jgi:hypothetical protein
MGMFDTIKCKYPLPKTEYQDAEFQTKDLDCGLDFIEIRDDGGLWREDYDTEDQSEAAKWLAENPGKDLPEELKGWKQFLGCMARVNNRWVRLADYTGELRFYNTLGERHTGWIEFSAYFKDGQLQQLNLVKEKLP